MAANINRLWSCIPHGALNTEYIWVNFQYSVTMSNILRHNHFCNHYWNNRVNHSGPAHQNLLRNDRSKGLTIAPLSTVDFYDVDVC